MKLLHVSPSMDPKLGGVCQAIRMIVSGLSEHGVENEVVTLDPPDAAYLKTDPFTIHTVGIGKGPWSYNANLIPWISQNLGKFDAIIVHGLWLYYGYAVRKALEHGNHSAKLFVMPHGMLDPYFQRAQGRKFKAIRNYVYWKLIESKLINAAHGLLFTCEEECRLAREPFRPYRPRRELIVGLGTDQPPGYTTGMRDAFHRRVPELSDSPYILFLSRIHEKKGVDLLLRAYANIRDNFKSPEAGLPKLVIAGPGLDTSYGTAMKTLAFDTLGLESLVLFPGMLSGDAKWGAFYGCQAFILPSHQENFGIAVIEALGCGKPVLISNQVNIWREIEGTGGGLIETDTIEGTAKLLKMWLEMGADKKQLAGENALEAFKIYFSKGPAAKKFLEAMNSR